MEPFIETIGPGGDGVGGFAKAVTVAAGGIHVEFVRDFFFLQDGGVNEGVLGLYGIVGRHGDEGLGSVRGNGEFGGELGDVFFGDKVAGVDEDSEIGFGRDSVGIVDFPVGAFLWTSAGDRGEMSARRKAENADAFGIDVPFGGVLTNEAHGALCVLERGGVFLDAHAAGDAVFEENGSEPHFVKAFADLRAFEIECEDVISAPGTDENGTTVGFVFGRRVESDSWVTDVAEADEAFPSDFVLGVLRHVAFGFELGFGTRCAVWPKANDGRIIRGPRGGGDEQSDGELVHRQWIKRVAEECRAFRIRDLAARKSKGVAHKIFLREFLMFFVTIKPFISRLRPHAHVNVIMFKALFVLFQGIEESLGFARTLGQAVGGDLVLPLPDMSGECEGAELAERALICSVRQDYG